MKIQLCGSRLGRVPCQSKLQRKIAGTSSWPSWISHFTGSFVGHSPSEMLCPPALFKKGEEGRKRKEVLHLSRCYTHTHTQTITHLSTYGPRAFVYVYVFIYIYIHTQIHTQIHIYIYIHTYIYIGQGVTCAPKIYSLVHRFWFRFWLSRTHKSLNYT